MTINAIRISPQVSINNANCVMSYPAGSTVGNIDVIACSAEGEGGTFSADGWEPVFDDINNALGDDVNHLTFLKRVRLAGDTAPTVSYEDGPGGSTVTCFLISFETDGSGGDDLATIFGAMLKGSATITNVQPPAVDLPPGAAVLFFGHVTDDTTSHTLTDGDGLTWVEGFHAPATYGGDSTSLCDYAINDTGSPITLTQKDFEIQGGSPESGTGLMLIVYSAPTPMSIASISFNAAPAGTSVVVTTENAAGNLTLPDFGGVGAIAHTDRTAQSITFLVPNVSLFGTPKALLFDEPHLLSVSDGTTTRTIPFTPRPPNGWFFGQIITISPDGVLYEDSLTADPLEPGDYIVAWVRSGDSDLTFDPTTGEWGAHQTSQLDYAAYDDSLSEWSDFITENLPVEADTANPTLAAASVEENAIDLRLVFSESVELGADGIGGITLDASGGALTATYLSGSRSNEIILRLGRQVIPSETITLDNAEQADGIKDMSGNALLTVSNYVVANNAAADTNPPTIFLVGGLSITLEVGTPYVEPGATAFDNVDGDVTSGIQIAGDTIDHEIPGVYIRTYNITDSDGYPAAQVIRTIRYIDKVDAMSQGRVIVNNLNLAQGEFPEIERKALFIGVGDTNQGTVLSINPQSDLDSMLGADNEIRRQVEAAIANGGENFFCWAAPQNAGYDWETVVDAAMPTVSPELIVLCTPATAAAQLTQMHTKAELLRTTLARRVAIITASAGIDSGSQSWAQYEAAQIALQDGVAAYRVAVVPYLFDNLLGALVGRLCNHSLSIADSPMRVASGPMLGLGEPPVDNNGIPLGGATLQNLDTNRISVVQTYVDHPGIFFGDLNMLDVPAGDYQVIEHLRVVDKACRAIRLVAIPKVADRAFNTRPVSIAAAKRDFMRPLLEMSHSTTVNGRHFPGEIEPPEDGDIVVTWPSRNEAHIYIKAEPYDSAKKIVANVYLDLSNPING